MRAIVCVWPTLGSCVCVCVWWWWWCQGCLLPTTMRSSWAAECPPTQAGATLLPSHPAPCSEAGCAEEPVGVTQPCRCRHVCRAVHQHTKVAPGQGPWPTSKMAQTPFGVSSSLHSNKTGYCSKITLFPFAAQNCRIATLFLTRIDISHLRE